MQSLTVGYTIEVHFVRLGQLTRKGGGLFIPFLQFVQNELYFSSICSKVDCIKYVSVILWLLLNILALLCPINVPEHTINPH